MKNKIDESKAHGVLCSCLFHIIPQDVPRAKYITQNKDNLKDIKWDLEPLKKDNCIPPIIILSIYIRYSEIQLKVVK